MITYEEDVDNENIVLTNNSESDAVLNIKSNLLKPPERLKVGNRLLEDSKNIILIFPFIIFIRIL